MKNIKSSKVSLM